MTCKELDRLKSKRRREYLKKEIVKLKSSPCVDCGETYPFYVMDFDHRPGTNKSFALSRGLYEKRPLSVLLEEIAKCDLVCANCHRARTYQRSIMLLPTKHKNDIKENAHAQMVLPWAYSVSRSCPE